MPPSKRRRWRQALAGTFVLGVVALAAILYFVVFSPPGTVSNPGVPFKAPTADSPPPPHKKAKRGKPARDTFRWPLYGYTRDHRRDFQPGHPLHGPWRQVWRFHAHTLLEFPPVIARGYMYQLGDNGRLVSLSKKTGRVRWRRKLGDLAASTPAIGRGRLYVTLLNGLHGSAVGRVVALKAKGGRGLWSHELPSRAESSPLLVGNRVYFGTEGGTLYCLDARNGHTIWTYSAHGAIKGSPTLSHGVLYFGDYGGHVQAVRASDGHLVWDASGGGTYYATAAVAFGRVYVGSTDGREYSFSQSDGSLAWAYQTGGYVYASAAVSNVKGLGPTVFVGSYSGTFYALDARSGGVRWSFSSGGRISGSATIVGGTVYFASLGRSLTFGLNTRSGHVVLSGQPGAFDPIVSDGKRLYLTSHSSLTALAPKSAKRRP